MGGETMAQGVAGGRLGPLDLPDRAGYRPLHGTFVNMMPANTAATRALRQPRRSKQELPGKAVVRPRKFPPQRGRHGNPAEATFQVLLMDASAPFHLLPQAL